MCYPAPPAVQFRRAPFSIPATWSRVDPAPPAVQFRRAPFSIRAAPTAAPRVSLLFGPPPRKEPENEESSDREETEAPRRPRLLRFPIPTFLLRPSSPVVCARLEIRMGSCPCASSRLRALSPRQAITAGERRSGTKTSTCEEQGRRPREHARRWSMPRTRHARRHHAGDRARLCEYLREPGEN